MKKTMSVSGLIALAITLVIGGQVYTQQPVPVEHVEAALAETPTAWFIELQGAPIADGGSAADLAREKQAFRNAARAAGVSFKATRGWFPRAKRA